MGLHKYFTSKYYNFISGNEADEMAPQQVKSSRVAAPNLWQKVNASFAVSQTFADGLVNPVILIIFYLYIASGWSRSRKKPTSESSLISRAILAGSVGGFVLDQVGLFIFVISMFGFSIVSLIDIA